MPALVQRILLSISHLIMIAIMALFVQGSWQQTLINLGNAAPASGISLGALYGVGILFGVIAILVLLGDLYCIVVGRLTHTLASEADEALEEAQRHKLDEQSAKH